jgi:periplasmic protein TonB
MSLRPKSSAGILLPRRLRPDAVLGESYLASALLHAALALLVISGARALDGESEREARRERVSRMVRAAVGKAGPGRTASLSGPLRLNVLAEVRAPEPKALAVSPAALLDSPPKAPKKRKHTERPARRAHKRLRQGATPPAKATEKPEQRPVQEPNEDGATANAADHGQEPAPTPSEASEESRAASAGSGAEAAGGGGTQATPATGAGAEGSGMGSSASDAPGVDKDALLRAYIASVSSAVHRRYRYPRPARRAGLQGEVVLEFRVDSKGRIHDVRVASSSGYRLLDRAAVEAVEQVAAVPPPPALLGWEDRRVKVAFVYALRG